uniref:Uncharacterized protein n=1 Tax=Chenopodium quinoa TaxID=63459 RepID=A0A803L294_CHEQI
MKKIEELEDCFILDFDPSEPADFSTLSLSKSLDLCDDKDVSVLAENGQCYCYVCEMAAPCKEWTKGLKHCDATNDDDEIWKLLKAQKTEA